MDLKEVFKKQGLTEEQINSILADMTTNKIYTSSIENVDIRYNKLKEDQKDINTQLTNANNTISDLKKFENENETLKNSISTYETEKINYENALKQKDFDFAIKNELSKYSVRNEKAILSLIDMEKVVLKDNEVAGFKEQIEALQKSDSYLFKSENGGTGGIPGGTPGFKQEPGKPNNNNEIGKKLGEEVSKMNENNKSLDTFFN